MKKLLALTLAVMMLFTLVACASDPAETSSQAPATSSEAPATSSEAPEASSEEPEASSEEPEASSEEPSEEPSEPEESSEPEPEVPVDNPYEELEIGKATTAPVVDGTVGEDEYATIIDYDELATHWNASSIGEDLDVYEAVLYLSWDENYLYTCVEVMVGGPRTYDNTDFASVAPHIFHRRHVMTAIVLGDPCLPKYQPANGTDWPWGDAYNSNLANEWSISAQPDGSPIKADHFGGLTSAEGYEYKIGVSGYDREYYEQRIPWSALNNGATFNAETGVKIGYAFVCCPEEVEYAEGADTSNDKYICFGAGVTGHKNFGEYVGMTLVD